MAESVQFLLNGQLRAARPLDGQSLLDHLRHDAGLMATRMGCGVGQCGACHVLIDGRSVASCSTPVWSLQGCSVTTLEGLGTPTTPHPLQMAFIEEQALQCGFCTSGLIMSAAALLQRSPQPDEDEIRRALDVHLCRCGVHQRVVRAVQRAVKTAQAQ
jgi:nicotinate dehydrogenase subunit A